MNKTYKVVFSKVRGALTVVNEATSSVQAKGAKTVVAAAAMLAMGSAMAESHWVVPGEDVPSVTNDTQTSLEALTEDSYSYTRTDSSAPSGFLSISSGSETDNVFDKTVWASGSAENVRAHALSVAGVNAGLTNTGTIYITSEKGAASFSQKGMMSNAGAVVVNKGTIVAKNAYGMTVGTASGTNDEGQSVGSRIINDVDGVIYVEGEGAGIELGGAEGSTAVNNGQILAQDSSDSWKHGVLINVNSSSFTNNGLISVVQETHGDIESSAIEVKSNAQNVTVTLDQNSKVEGVIHFAEVTAEGVTDSGNKLIADGAKDTLNLKSDDAGLDFDVINGADITLADRAEGEKPSKFDTVTVEGAKLTASIFQANNQFKNVNLNSGGVFNITALNSNSEDLEDGVRDRLLLSFGSKWNLNGGDLQVGGNTFTGLLKIGSADSSPDYKGTGVVNVTAGNYSFSKVEFGSADGNQLNISGGALTVGEFDMTNGATTVTGGTLAIDQLTREEGGQGTLTVDGGTLQTSSGQLFTTALGTDGQGEESGALKYSGVLTLQDGSTIALTDGLYNLAYAAAAGEAAGEGVSVVMLGSLVADDIEGLGNTATLDEVKDVGPNVQLVGVTVESEGMNVKIGGDEPTGTDTDTTAYRAESLHVAALDLGEGDTVTIDGGKTLTLVGNNGELISSESTEGVSVDVTNGTLALGGQYAQGGNLNGKVELVGASQMNVTGSETFEVAAVSGTGTVNVGDETTAGRLNIGSLEGFNGMIFVDPAWGEGVNLVSEASQLGIYEATDMTSQVVAGRNSVVGLGVAGSEAAAALQGILDVNQNLQWGEDLQAAVYVGDAVTFGSTGGVLVDGSLTARPASVTPNTVTVASNSILIANQAVDTSENALIGGTVAFNEGSYLGLANASVGEFKLADATTGETLAQVVTDNPFIKGTLGTGDQAGTVIASYDTENGLSALASTGLQAMTRRADTILAQTIADRTSIDQELNPGINLWVDVTGESYEADNFDNGGEFTADMGYGAFGGDIAINDFTVGAAFQYGTGSLRSSVSSIKNDIDNYAFTLYGTYKVTDAFKLAAELAYVWGENDISSSQAALNQSVDTEMYSFGLRAMYELTAGNFSFVPSIGVRVSQLSTDAMQVGSVKVEDQDQTLVQVPIALRINASEFDANGWSVAPSFKIAYVPTFGDKDIEVLGHSQDVIDTAPVQADFGLRVGKDNMLFNVNMLLGSGENGTSAIGGKVGFKYAF